MAGFKVGDRVRIRQWKDMEKQFGKRGTGSIDCQCGFTKYMKHLCGRLATIKSIDGERMNLIEWSDLGGDCVWSYSTDMIEAVSSRSNRSENERIKPGDKVKVIDRGCNYTTYTDHIKACAPEYIDQFHLGVCAENGAVGTVKHVGKHLMEGRYLAIVQIDKRVYLIGIDGLERTPSQSIHITTDGNTVHALLKDGDEVVKRAKASCAPSDTFDFAVGAKLAFDRLFDAEVREVKRAANVGEWIKIVDPDYTSSIACDDYEVGEIHEVVSLYCSGVQIKGNRNRRGLASVYHREYVVLENYTPPAPPKPKYWSGKVVCVAHGGCNQGVYTIGKVYSIVDGIFTATDNGVRLRVNDPITSFEDWCKFTNSKFIEYKGECK